MEQLPAYLSFVLGDAFVIESILLVGFVLFLNIKSALRCSIGTLSDEKQKQ